MTDKYGVGQDPDCYPGTSVLVNLFGIQNESQLETTERDVTTGTAETIDFNLPPYDLSYLCTIHEILFKPIYPWAGKLRSVDISKGNTRFCTVSRIEPEANKLFSKLEKHNFYAELGRSELVKAVSELYAEINMLHPFREGNGRAQRIMFEHLIINVGYEISWQPISMDEWVSANISSVYGDYSQLEKIFEKCIGAAIE